MMTDYTIVSKPDHIDVICPHCDEDVRIPFDQVNFKSSYWGDGGWCTCPECGKDIELGDYEYD